MATPRPAVEGQALTPRELQVLEQMALGMSRLETAELLFMAPSTVATHRERLSKKLGARNGAHAVMLAIRSGLLKVD